MASAWAHALQIVVRIRLTMRIRGMYQGSSLRPHGLAGCRQITDHQKPEPTIVATTTRRRFSEVCYDEDSTLCATGTSRCGSFPDFSCE